MILKVKIQKYSIFIWPIIFILFLSGFQDLKSQDLNAGLISKYLFSGNTNDATGTNNGINHGAQLTADRFGNANSAFYFDGSGVYIEIPDNNQLDFSYNEDFSISLWVNIASDQNDLRGHNNEILGKWNAFNSTGYPYAIRYWNTNAAETNKNKIFNLRYDSQSCGHNPLITGSCSISNNEWHHLALVKEGSLLSYYQDGQLFGTTTDNTVSSCNTVNNNPVYIGKRDLETRFYTGSIDDISFYGRALTIEEIMMLVTFNGWAPPPPPTSPDIVSFEIPGEINNTINPGNNTIHVVMPCDTDLTQLAANFVLSDGANAYVNEIPQLSGVSQNDFTSPVLYKVRTNDACYESEWTVVVDIQAFSEDYINNVTSILDYSVSNQIEATQYDYDSKTISVVIPCNEDITQVISTFTLPNGSNAFIGGIIQTSNITINDFSNSLTYTIQNLETCSEMEWEVTVETQSFPQEYIDGTTSFETYNIAGQSQPTEIDNSSHKIAVLMPCGADLSNLKSWFTMSYDSDVEVDGASQLSGLTVNNFSNPAIYLIQSPEGCYSAEWNVTVSIDKLNFETVDLYGESFFVPNVITPNNDNRNDAFIIGTYLQGSELKIFNRHGIKVFETDDYRNQFTGSSLASGTYFYSINSVCLEKPIVGPLSILK